MKWKATLTHPGCAGRRSPRDGRLPSGRHLGVHPASRGYLVETINSRHCPTIRYLLSGTSHLFHYDSTTYRGNARFSFKLFLLFCEFWNHYRYSRKPIAFFPFSGGDFGLFVSWFGLEQTMGTGEHFLHLFPFFQLMISSWVVSSFLPSWEFPRLICRKIPG